jgi:uncharacterized protein (TIGR02145 family)
VRWLRLHLQASLVFPSPKEQNPYSVENMNKTFKDLVLANNPNAKSIPKLEANFLYVRFLPYGKQGEHELKAYDTALVLFNHPMDYNDIREPAVYVDETLPDSIVPYFASVPAGYEFGPTPYEILQELFLTQPLEEDDGDGQENSRFVKAKKSNKANKKIADYLKSQGLAPYHLEIAAFPDSEGPNAKAGIGSGKALAKNAPPDMDNIVAGWPWNWSRWTPGGKLEYRDERDGDIPLVGVKVTAGYKFYWRSSYTDSDGKFKSPEKWTLAVRYEAHFGNDKFVLQDGHPIVDLPVLNKYKVNLEYPKGGTSYDQWNHTFKDDQAKWCVVWTAAYNYWKGNDIGGLKRPRNSLWSMAIEVYYKDNNDFKNKFGKDISGDFNYTAGLENISIKANQSHLNVYGTAIHEIAHSSHYANLERADYSSRLGTYGDFDAIFKESYADGISRYLTNKRYGAWGKASYNRVKGYTGIFEDLEDADPTFARTENDKNPCDRVSGITVPMAEKVFFKSYSWNGFKNNLMKAYPNGTPNGNGGKVTYTAEDMDALFKYWETGETSCLKDFRDGKVYKTTKIGTQKWMAENLNYNPNAGNSVCYSNSAANCDKYGRLYDWSTAMVLPSSCNSYSVSNANCNKTISSPHKGICPDKWHVPSVEDWNKLMRYIDGNNSTHSPYDSPTAGIHLKAKSGWNGGYISDIWYGGNGKDTYGFSALPGGIGNPGGGFKDMGYNGDWWSAAEYDGNSAYRFDLYYGDKAGWSDIGGSNRRYDKASLFSVRCLEN